MKVIVIGGGASGMLAACTAAEAGHAVTVCERQARVGKKLLATGNGRCNLSNHNLSPEHYHGSDTAFTAPAFAQADFDRTMEFFHALGLMTVEEPSGKIYPYSDQAGSVVDLLRFALDRNHVTVETGCEITSIRRTKAGFVLKSEAREFTADRVIVCCGGAAGSKLGGGSYGYELLRKLGHKVTPLCPALVQVKTDTDYVRSLKGVRADAKITVRSGSETVAENTGEVQFTEFGISGPAVFEVSRVLSVSNTPLIIHLDLLRQLSTYQTERLLADHAAYFPDLTLENLLTGVLQNRLGRTVIRYAGFDLNRPVRELKPRELKKIAAAIKDFRLEYRGTNGFDQAQVTAGGVKTSEFYPDTLESRLVPGLYAAGEVLDIDGDCGGYNLQWAWSSGMLAGQLLSHR